MDESKRIVRLRSEVVKVIPKFPNNRETKEKLENMPLAMLFVHYLNWISRYISIKPRKVAIEPTVTSDQRWKLVKEQLEMFLDKVRSGENLTPYLSNLAHSKGYSPEASEKGPGVDRWMDKDFLLNAMGFHHFHLGTKLGSTGRVERTDDVLFARVGREEFTAIGIFNHSVFEQTGEEMSEERKRLWKIFEDHTSRGGPPGSIVISSPIVTSGHPIHLVGTAQEYARIISEVDPKLDDPEFVKGLYKESRIELSPKVKLEWALNFSDLGIHEKRGNHFFVLRRGFN